MLFKKRKRQNKPDSQIIEHADRVHITNVNVKVLLKNEAIVLLVAYVVLKTFLQKTKK